MVSLMELQRHFVRGSKLHINTNNLTRFNSDTNMQWADTQLAIQSSPGGSNLLPTTPSWS